MANKSYEDYLNSVKLTKMSRFNLPKPDHEETLGELVAQGYKLLEEDSKTPAAAPKKKTAKKDDTKRLEKKLASTSTNPYVRARVDVLNKMNPEARSVIEKMEKGLLPKDLRYETFCKAVRILGDQLSDSP